MSEFNFVFFGGFITGVICLWLFICIVFGNPFRRRG